MEAARLICFCKIETDQKGQSVGRNSRKSVHGSGITSFRTSPEMIRILYSRDPFFLRIAGDLLSERGIEISHEVVRL